MLTVDASALGAANGLTFNTNVTGGVTFTGNLTLIGGAGNDIFQGGSGANIFNGGAGSDTVSFASGRAHTGVVVDLSITGPQSVGGPRGGADTFTSIENLTGTLWNDTLTGGFGANILDGMSGNDVLNGGGGDDTLIGDLGNSTLDGGTGTDIAVFSHDRVAYTVTRSGSTTTISGPDGTETLTNVEFAQFRDQTVQIAGAVVTTANRARTQNQTLALSSLFSVSDLDGNAITQYQLYDGNSDPNSGHFVVAGVAQSANTVITITAGQLAQTSFVTGTVNDSLQIRAFDGNSWSAADNELWAPFKLSVMGNNPAILTTPDVNETAGQALALSSLFSVNTLDNDTIVKYQLFDASPNPASGYVMVNGVAKPAETVIDLTPAQLAQTYFVAGTSPDTLFIRAFDGTDWSAPSGSTNRFWSSINIIPPNPPANHAPIVTPSFMRVAAGTTIPLTSLFSVSDADGDTITRYQFKDSGGGDASSNYFLIDGVREVPFYDSFDLTAAQLSHVSLVTGTGADVLSVRVFDGTSWSAASLSSSAAIIVGPLADHAPVISTANITRARSQALPLSNLFSVSDADGDAITAYQLFDVAQDPALEALSGHFEIDGQAQPSGVAIDVTADQLSHTTFVTGVSSDTLWIRASDGIQWSAYNNGWSPFSISVPNTGPAITAPDVTRAPLRSYALSSMISASDADGDAVLGYGLWDDTSDPNSGHFVVNGQVQAARTSINITPDQLSQTFFVTGSVGDILYVNARDSLRPGNTATLNVTVTAGANQPPIVTTGDITRAAGQSLTASSLFTVSDADNDTVTKYQFWDTTTDPLSGHFVVNGAPQAARTVIELPASDLSQVSFLTGSAGDMLQVRAFDGTAWSAADSAQWSPFHIAIS